MTYRVVAIEDDPRYRSGLVTLLRHSPDFTMEATFGSAEAALAQLESDLRIGRRPRWDLVLMDLQLPGMSGSDAIPRIKALLGDVKVVALTVFEEPRTVLRAICAGADGYVLKRTSAGELVRQLRVVIDGGSPLTPGVARTVLEVVRGFADARKGEPAFGPRRLSLTQREQDVLRCLGLTPVLTFTRSRAQSKRWAPQSRLVICPVL